MARLIDNDAAERVLSMDAALDAIDAAFTQQGEGQANFYPLQQLVSPTATDGDAYVWGHHVGAVRDPPRLAFRYKSDVTDWEEDEQGNRTREKFNVERGTFMGVIMLFDSTNGELLAVMNDGVVQHVRVGATAGVACDHFAREDADTVGMVGSGGMAEVYLEAFDEVRDLDAVRVYSPTKANRDAYAAEMEAELGVPVVAVEDPETAVRGADIVSTCTDASQPVIEADWLDDGAFFTNVRAIEIPQAAIDGADRCFATTNQAYETRMLGDDEEREYLTDRADHGDHDTDFPTLGDVLCGRDEGRRDDDETIYFDNRAAGIQFAAVGDLVYEAAEAEGLGVELPLSWFQQNMRN